VKAAEIPGGMYTNMLAQLKQGKLDHKFDEVLKLVPKVRLDAGCPPLVTPTSQIVGSQAVNLVLDEAKGKSFYTAKTNEFIGLVKGEYGKTPWPVDPEFRLQIAGVREETPYDTSKHQKQENPVFPEFGGVTLCADQKDELLMELFPSVAFGFLKKIRESEYQAKLATEQQALAEEEAKKPVRPPIKPVTVLTDSMIDDLYGAW
jgi:oxaloacetate decarboxylase alpha subunit/pyruvate carboxylase subunit B